VRSKRVLRNDFDSLSQQRRQLVLQPGQREQTTGPDIEVDKEINVGDDAPDSYRETAG